MALTYRERPDGLMDVTIKSGQTIPVALTRKVLEAQSYAEAPRTGPDMRLAQADAAPTEQGPQMDAGSFVPKQWGKPPEPSAPPPATDASDFVPREWKGPTPVPAPYPSGLDGRGEPVTPQQLAPPRPAGSRDPSSLTPAAGPQQPVQARSASSGPASFDATGLAEYAAYLDEDRGSPGVYVPGGDQRTSYQVRQGKSPSKDALEEQADAEVQQRLAMQTQTDLASERARQEANLLRQRNDAEERALAEQEKENAKRKGEYEQRLRMLDQRVTEVESMKVDPNRIFSGPLGTAGKIIAAIGIAIGGSRRGGNPALQIQNEIIERDIAAQKEQIANAREGLRLRSNALAQAMELYGDPVTAEKDLRLRMTAFADAKMREMVAKSGDQELQARLQEEFAKRDAARAQQRAELEMQLQPDVVEQYQYLAPRVVGGRRPLDPLEKAERLARYRNASETAQGTNRPHTSGEAANKRLVGDRQLALDDGRVVWFSDAATKVKAQDSYNLRRNLATQVQKLKEILAKPAHSLSPAERADYESTVIGAQHLFAKGLEMGALQEHEEKRLNAALPREGAKLTSYEPSTLRAFDAVIGSLQTNQGSWLNQAYTDPFDQTSQTLLHQGLTRTSQQSDRSTTDK